MYITIERKKVHSAWSNKYEVDCDYDCWYEEVEIDEVDILKYFRLPVTEDTKKVIEELYLMDFLGELFEDKDFQEYIDRKYPIDED